MFLGFYVGQTDRLEHRVYYEHATAIRDGKVDSLHYFTLARGYGHRRALFLRLWETSPATSDEDKIQYALIQNLLEMTFCRCFESLPAIVLTEYFGTNNYANVGLNNMLPLVQGGRIAQSLRAKYLEYHKQSPDPDVIEFTKVRPQQKAAERQARMVVPKAIFTRDYQQAMIQLLQALEFNVDSIADFATPASYNESVDIQDELQRLSSNGAIPLFAPVGNHLAKVGVVLDSEGHIDGDQNLTEPFKIVRLNKGNSLIWTTSFQELGTGPSWFRTSPDVMHEINSLNYFTIMGSGLRVIILCGLRTQHAITSSFERNFPAMPTSQPRPELLGPFQLPLEGTAPTVWLLCHGKDVSRVFIACPESPEILNKKYSTQQLRDFQDAFGLAAALTGEKIKYTFMVQYVYRHASKMPA